MDCQPVVIILNITSAGVLSSISREQLMFISIVISLYNLSCLCYFRAPQGDPDKIR